MGQEAQRLMSAMNYPTDDLPHDPDEEELQNLYFLYFRAAGQLEHIESALQHERQMAIVANTPIPFLDEAWGATEWQLIASVVPVSGAIPANDCMFRDVPVNNRTIF